MSLNETNIDAHSKPQLRRWQFGLREMFVAMLVFSLWCAIASWSLFDAIFLGAVLASAGAALRAACHPRRPMLWGLSATLVIISFGLLAALFPLNKSSRAEKWGRVNFLVVDARNRIPIANADVTLTPNGNRHASELELGDEAGVVKLEALFLATKHDGPWGQARYTLYFPDTEMFVSALGYEGTTLYWEDVSSVRSRSVNASPETIVVELHPIPSSKNR